MNRAARVAWPALTSLVALAVAVPVATALVGGVDVLGGLRVVVRTILGLAASGVLGVLILATVVLRPGDARRGRLLDAAAIASAVWALAAATTGFLLYLGQAPALSSPAFGPGLVTFALDLEVGRTWLLAAILPAVLTAALLAVRSRIGTAVLMLAAIVALVPVALQAQRSADPLALVRVLFDAQLVQLAVLGAWFGAATIGAALALPVRRSFGVASGAVLVVVALVASGPRAVEGTEPGAIVGWLVLLVMTLVVALLARHPAAARIQLLLLGVLVGTGAAIETVRGAAPPQLARTSPAAILTGAPLPGPPSLSSVLLTVRPDALWLVVCAALLVGHLVVLRAARRRGTTWPPARSAAWILGVILLAWLTNGGPAEYQPVLISAHLAQHAALLLPVPLLLAAGAPVRLLRQASGRPIELRRIPRPVPAVVVAAATVVGLYGTDLLDRSLVDPAVATGFVAVCLLVGCLLVASVQAAPRRPAVTASVAMLLLEAVGAVALGASTGLLHAEWFGAMGWGTDALVDQRVGAVISWMLVSAPTIVLLVGALRSPRAAARPARPSTRRIEEEVPA